MKPSLAYHITWCQTIDKHSVPSAKMYVETSLAMFSVTCNGLTSDLPDDWYAAEIKTRWDIFDNNKYQ